MVREVITLQVGQAGNQIGAKFWEQALAEHAEGNKRAVYDAPLSTFFKNTGRGNDGAVGRPVERLKARAAMVDMEEGVTRELLRGRMGEVMDRSLLLAGSGGSGNNFAAGLAEHGPQHEEKLRELVRRPAEECDSLQGFLMLHSLGGGTGSGVGCYLLGMLRDEFPEALRFSCSVFPSEDDDVITSPYNTTLAAAHLLDKADCVFPVENEALQAVCEEAGKKNQKYGLNEPGKSIPAGENRHGRGGKPFDGMNGVASRMLLNLTAGARFEGDLNVDLGEVLMNLVPFPQLNCVTSSMAPLVALADVAKRGPAPRSLDEAFNELFCPGTTLVSAQPRRHTHLASAFLARGSVAMADISRNISRSRSHFKLPAWNEEGFKVGICNRPPSGLPFCLLGLSNSCCSGIALGRTHSRFRKFRSRSLYLHHYTQALNLDDIDNAAGIVKDAADAYAALDAGQSSPPEPRFRPVGIP